MKKWLVIVLVCNHLNAMERLAKNTFVLRTLLTLGILNPDKQNSDGSTMLHRVAAVENLEQLKVLIKYTTHPATRDKCGWTPLHYAALKGNHILIRLLSQAGASVNDPTNPKTLTSPLHLATYRLHLDATRALLDAGAEPHATNIHQQTPLHEICLSQAHADPSHKLEIMSLLVEHAMRKGNTRDSYVLAQDSDGNTAADYLRDTDQELIDFLLPESEYNRRKFYRMLADRGMNTIDFLHKRELRLIH